MNNHTDDNEMLEEVDFSDSPRGTPFPSTPEGRRVYVTKEDGTVEVHHYHPLEGRAKELDPILLLRFPDAKSVNDALRAYLASVGKE